MEAAVGVGGAVRGDEQVRAVEVRGAHRRQLDLHGPLAEQGRGGAGHAGRGGRFLPAELSGLRAGAAAGQRLGRGLLGLTFPHGLPVVCGRFPLLKGDGSRGAGRQAVAQTVAVVLAHEPGLAVDHVDGALVTGLGAQTAAVAFVLVNVDDLSYHDRHLRFLFHSLLFLDFLARVYYSEP